jgi:hypothetical protein
MEEVEKITDDSRCVTCDAPLQGKYCHHCGEKHIDPARDYDVPGFLKDNLELFLHLDAKILQSFAIFFLKPGYLADAFIRGRRRPYMKPLAMFLTIALVVHFFLPNVNVYFVTFNELRQGMLMNQVSHNLCGFDVDGTIQLKSAKLGYTPQQFENLAFQQAWVNSKTYLFAIVPLWGLAFWGAFYDRMRYYVPNLIFSLYSFGFFMAIDLIYLKFMAGILGFHAINDVMFLPLFFGFCLYLWFAIQKVYGAMHPLSLLLRMVAILIAFIVILMIYRQLISILTLAWM